MHVVELDLANWKYSHVIFIYAKDGQYGTGEIYIRSIEFPDLLQIQRIEGVNILTLQSIDVFPNKKECEDYINKNYR